MIERTLNRKNQTHLQQTYHDMFNKHRGMSPFDRLKVDGQHQKNRQRVYQKQSCPENPRDETKSIIQYIVPHIVSEEEALEEKKKKLIEKKSHERRRRRSIFRNKPIVGETHEPSHRDQQIRMLKLELQRYQRCELITKDNEALYKVLIDKINKQTQDSILRLTRKVQFENEDDDSFHLYLQKEPTPVTKPLKTNAPITYMEALSPFTMHENSQHDTNGDAKKKISPQKYVPRAHAKSQREFAIPLYDSKAVTFNEQPKQGLQATYSSQKNRSDNAIQQYQGSKMTLDDTVTNESLLHRMNEQLEQSYSKRALTQFCNAQAWWTLVLVLIVNAFRLTIS